MPPPSLPSFGGSLSLSLLLSLTAAASGPLVLVGPWQKLSLLESVDQTIPQADGP